jgi:hypothetical protein
MGHDLSRTLKGSQKTLSLMMIHWKSDSSSLSRIRKQTVLASKARGVELRRLTQSMHNSVLGLGLVLGSERLGNVVKNY